MYLFGADSDYQSLTHWLRDQKVELLSLWEVGVELKQRSCIFSRRKWKIWKEIVITFNLLQHTAGSYSAEKTPPFPMNSSKSAILKLSLTLVLSLSSSFCWSSLSHCLVDFVAALLCSGLLTLWKVLNRLEMVRSRYRFSTVNNNFLFHSNPPRLDFSAKWAYFTIYCQLSSGRVLQKV